MSEKKAIASRVSSVDFSDDGICTLNVDMTGLDLAIDEPLKFNVNVEAVLGKGQSSEERKHLIIEALKAGIEDAILDRKLKKAHLPAHVAIAGVGAGGVKCPDTGGNSAYILHAFLGNPISDFTRQGKKSVQLELNFKDLSIVGAEVFTYKNGVQAALTGLEDNVFCSLFNDRFLGISSRPGQRSIIQGDTKSLQKIMGNNAPRISALNEIVRNLSRMEFSVPGAGHELHGRVFPAALCPDESATQSNEKHHFKFEVSDWIPAALLKQQYEMIDLRIFWSIENPAARRLYAYMKRIKNSHAPKIETVCERVGLLYPLDSGKASRERRAKSKAALRKYMEDIEKNTDGLVSPGGRGWFVGNKVQWSTPRLSESGELKDRPNRITDKDKQAEHERLWKTMPAEAKEQYKLYKSKGVSFTELDKMVKRYSREGSHLQIAQSSRGQKRH